MYWWFLKPSGANYGTLLCLLLTSTGFVVLTESAAQSQVLGEEIELLPAPTEFAYYSDGDYSNCTECRIPAGIYFKISQKGIDYITDLAARALPQLLNNSALPDVNGDGVKIVNMNIERFEQPKIKAHLVKGAGVGAEVVLPHVIMSAIYDVRSFLTSARGKLRAEIQNLSIIMEVHMRRNESAKLNIITTPICNVTSHNAELAFAGDWSSAALNAFKSIINAHIVQVLADQLCEIPITVAHFFEQQKRAILSTTPVPTPSAPTTPEVFFLKHGESIGAVKQKTTTEPPVENEDAFYETSEEEPDEDLAAKFATDLCALEDAEEEKQALGEVIELHPAKELSKRSVNTPQRFNSKLTDASWAPDLTLMYPPNFTDTAVLFGLDGGIVMYGQKAKNVPRPEELDTAVIGDQMFGLLISEYVPNTFLTHIHDNGLGSIFETFKSHNLPKRPEMSIDHTGVKMNIDGDVAIKFVSRWKTYNLVSAGTKLHVVVKPYVRYSRVYGDVALAKLDIQMKGMGLRGMFANSLKKAINAVIPKKLWPKIKKRLRFALTQRGIRLPVMCGVELEKPSLEYTDHAIVINTDFSYDLPRFIRKFKIYIQAEIEKGRKKSAMEDDFDYARF